MEKTIEKERQVARCPYCGQELTHLLDYATRIQLFEVVFLDDGPLYEFVDEADSFEKEEFYCPYCGSLLANDINEAKKILRGGNHGQ